MKYTYFPYALFAILYTFWALIFIVQKKIYCCKGYHTHCCNTFNGFHVFCLKKLHVKIFQTKTFDINRTCILHHYQHLETYETNR